MDDCRRLDELVERLIECHDALSGYRMNPKWKDGEGLCFRPDRVLEHPALPPIGVELSEILPGSRAMLACALWDDVYGMVAKRRELAGVTLHFAGLKQPHTKRQNPQLAREIIAMVDRYASPLLGELGDAELEEFPLLRSTITNVRLMRHDEQGGFLAPYYLHLPPDWFDTALSSVVRKHSASVAEYRSNIADCFRAGHAARVMMLVWARNEMPPNPPQLFFDEPDLAHFSRLLGEPGFDAIWYCNGVRDNTTSLLSEPVLLYRSTDE